MKHLSLPKSSSISFTIAIILFLNLNIFAQKVSYNGVEKVAINAYSINSNQNRSDFKIKEVIPVSEKGEITFYIFNFEPKGHIVVSNDKAFEPILGYGLNSNIDLDSIPPGLKYLLYNFQNEISYARKQGVLTSEETIKKWGNYLSSNETSGQNRYSNGTYLVQTKWGQGSAYNRFCPTDPLTSNRTIVGCGGVAFGQILNYWHCRVFPDNSTSYTPRDFQNPINLTFSGQNYNWANMSTNSPDDNNALLLYHSAVSIHSNFSDRSTSSYMSNAQTAFTSYFGFNASSKHKRNYPNETWINMLKTEINAERPIFYTGFNYSENEGHAWVIDGYNSSNDKFHCNWGWSGNYDDWYLLSALNVYDYSFNDGQSAILNIYPLLDACSGLNGSTSICSLNRSYSVSTPSSASVVWSKSSNLIQVGDNTGSTYTVRAANSSQSSTGLITSTIYNSQNQVFITRTKSISIGPPSAPSKIIGFYRNGMEFGSESIYEFSVNNSTNQVINQYHWVVGGGTILSGQGTSTITVKTVKVSGSNNVFFDVTVKHGNDCGWSSPLWRSGYVTSGVGPVRLSIYPNPTKDILYVEINKTEQPYDLKIAKGEIRLYDKMMGLKKVKRFDGTSTSMSVSDLKSDVYFLQIITGDETYQEQVIISRE